MIKINLAPTTKKGKAPKPKAVKAPRPGVKISVQFTFLYVIGIIVVVAIIAVLLLTQSSRINTLNSNVNQLTAKLDELKVYKAAVDSLEMRERELGLLIAPIRELNKNRFFIAHILEEISKNVPEFTWLTSLNANQATMGLQGITASNLLVADFMNRLEDSPYIHNVDLTVLQKRPVGKQEMMEFTLTANVGFEQEAGRQQ
jgi:Tfp pilus assembly protein PilN